MSIRVLCSGTVLAALIHLGAAAIQLDITRDEIERALTLARGSDAERARFHAPYQLAGTKEAVERLEVITEYRRIVLIAESRIAAGDRAFATGTRLAEEALTPWKRRLAVKARIRFHPQNAYPKGPPDVSIAIGEGPGELAPIQVTVDPQYAFSSPSDSFSPLIGMVIEAIFDAAAVGQRTLPIVLRGPGPLEVRRTAEFGGLR